MDHAMLQGRGMLFAGHRQAHVLIDDLGAERLGDERRAFGQIPWLGYGQSGSDDDRDMRPPLGGPAREREPVQVARHVDVREQQIDLAVKLFEDLEGIGDVYRIAHAKPCIFQDVSGIHQDEGVVVDDESAGRLIGDAVGHAL